MREKIWYEMVHTKFGDIYLAHYLSRQKTIRKWWKIFTLIFSTAGVFGWAIWEYIPIISCTLIGIMQIINLVENQIIMSDDDLNKVCELRNQYTSYFNKLEKFWTEFNIQKMTDENATEPFYQLRIIGEQIEELDNKIDVRIYKKLKLIADIEARNYLTQYHN